MILGSFPSTTGSSQVEGVLRPPEMLKEQIFWMKKKAFLSVSQNTRRIN